ncbi:Uncharacterised protein [Mycobacteroides abscessus]|nr:Uncharacterised protein [Mycobacteroides abscessus]
MTTCSPDSFPLGSTQNERVRSSGWSAVDDPRSRYVLPLRRRACPAPSTPSTPST